MEVSVPERAPASWARRLELDQAAREELAAHGHTKSPRAFLASIYARDGCLKIHDGDARAQVLEKTIERNLTGTADWRRGEEVTLVDDLRCFHMLSVLFLGPVALVRFPRDTYVVGSAVQMCLCVRRRPYDQARSVLLEEWRKRKDWFALVRMVMRRSLGATGNVTRVVDLIALFAREAEQDIGERVRAAQGAGNSPARRLLLPSACWDPMEWESGGEGETRFADIDICFCQSSQGETERAIQSVYEQLALLVGKMPMRQTSLHGTVTIFMPWPWRRVQLKRGRCHLLHRLFDADAAPTACCMQPQGPNDPGTPQALPRALEAFEFKVNLLHMRTLLHRADAQRRAAKYAGRGFKPLLVGCDPTLREHRKAARETTKIFVRSKFKGLGDIRPVRWQALHSALLRGAVEEFAAVIDQDEDARVWCRALSRQWRGAKLPQALEPRCTTTEAEIMREARARVPTDASSAETEEEAEEHNEPWMHEGNDGEVDRIAQTEEDSPREEATIFSLDGDLGLSSVTSAGKHTLDTVMLSIGVSASVMRRTQDAMALAVAERRSYSRMLRILAAPSDVDTPAQLRQAMRQYFGKSVRRVYPLQGRAGQAVLWGPPRIVAEVCITYSCLLADGRYSDEAADRFLETLLDLAPACRAGDKIWSAAWAAQVLRRATWIANWRKLSTGDASETQVLFDYESEQTKWRPDRSPGNWPEICAEVSCITSPNSRSVASFSDIAPELAQPCLIPLDIWVKHGYIRDEAHNN